jgi:16S rRNA (cytosine967-C5)-methyltransferase
VNGVLRSISRSRGSLPLPARPFDDDRPRQIAYLSTTLSHPRWLAERALERVGFDAAERWARFNNASAPLTIRANTLKRSRADLTDALRQHGVSVEPARFAPDALVVASGNPLQTPLADEGAFFVQDEASQLVGLFTLAAPGERIFDACASPGGKTAAMAAMMHDTGLIVASDFRPRRVALLHKTIAAAGARSNPARASRSAASAALPPRVRLRTVDAPYSGTRDDSGAIPRSVASC